MKQLNRIRSYQFTVACVVKGQKNCAIGIKVDSSEKINIDAYHLLQSGVNYTDNKKEIIKQLEFCVKEILKRTGSTNYSTFTLYDENQDAVIRYVGYPFYNEMQFGMWEEEKGQFDWRGRFRVANGGLQEVINETASEVANGIFEVMEEKYFEFK